MAYDAATGTAVLFGGSTVGQYSATPGPGTAPPGPSRPRRPARPPGLAAMAYDAATSTAVLFGGQDSTGQLVDGTWTWDGSDWTSRPRRSARAPEKARR